MIRQSPEIARGDRKSPRRDRLYYSGIDEAQFALFGGALSDDCHFLRFKCTDAFASSFLS